MHRHKFCACAPVAHASSASVSASRCALCTLVLCAHAPCPSTRPRCTLTATTTGPSYIMAFPMVHVRHVCAICAPCAGAFARTARQFLIRPARAQTQVLCTGTCTDTAGLRPASDVQTVVGRNYLIIHVHDGPLACMASMYVRHMSVTCMSRVRHLCALYVRHLCAMRGASCVLA